MPILAGLDRFQADRVHPSVVHALEAVARRPALFARLIGPGGDASFNRIFTERSTELAMQALAIQCADEPVDAVPQEFRARASTAMFLAVCGYWLDRGCDVPVESIANWYWTLVHPVWFPD